MLTVRLSEDLEKEIERIATEEKATKSQVIKNALKEYIKKRKLNKTPYELGKDLFGKFEFDEESLSKSYKEKIKEKLLEKYSH